LQLSKKKARLEAFQYDKSVAAYLRIFELWLHTVFMKNCLWIAGDETATHKAENRKTRSCVLCVSSSHGNEIKLKQ